MIDWDVVVIGAGPAGSVAAREIARRGPSVLLLDKARFPRRKVCGGCLNGTARAALNSIGLGHIPELKRALPLTRVRIGAGGRTADLPYSGGLAVDREAFDSALLTCAADAGVTVRTGVAAHIGPCTEHARTVHLSGDWTGDVSARIVVNAAGLAGNDGSPVRGSRIGGGVIVASEHVPDYYAPGTVYLTTGSTGYVGLVRISDNRLTVGVAFDPAEIKARHGLGTAAADRIAGAGWPAIRGLADLDWKGTPSLTRCSAAAGERLFAVGDAAAYVEPFTGEGMAWALESAIALAPVAVIAVGGWTDTLQAEWSATFSRWANRRQRLAWIVARVLRSPWQTAILVRLLSSIPAVSRPITNALNGRWSVNPVVPSDEFRPAAFALSDRGFDHPPARTESDTVEALPLAITGQD